MIKLEARRAFTDEVQYEPIDRIGLCGCVNKKQDMDNGSLYEIHIKNESKEDFIGVVHIRLEIDVKDFCTDDLKFFMPGYMYGNNTADMPNHGRKEFPRIIPGAYSRPESNFWMTRSDRLAEPVSILYYGGRVLGISAKPCLIDENGDFKQFCGFTCGVWGDNTECKKASVGYTLGYENAPWLFVQTATVCDREPVTQNNSCKISAGEEVSLQIRVYDYVAEDETGVHQAIKDVYAAYHQSPRKIEGMTVKKATKMLADAIRDYAWLEDEHMYSGFVYDRENGFEYNKIYSLTWTNGLSVACPMLLAANRMQDARMREQALSFIGEVLAHSYNPSSGLLYEAINSGVWSTRGWWYSGMHSGGHSSYLNGQAVYYILKSFISEQKYKGIEHKEWLEFVAPVIEKLNSIKNTDNEYPFAMSEKTGAGLEYDSMSGAWCLAATALFSQLTDDQKYLEGMRLSEQHYYDYFVKKVVCYGGPLDTDKAVENESVLAFIRAARILHEITGEDIYLNHLRDAIYYEVSYKLGYNTHILVNPLAEIGWSSCGGSITSVANPHIHPMSSTIVDEMMYYLQFRTDEYVESRLQDTILWGMQTFNTFAKEYGYGRTGWMSERFCFCQGLLVEKYPDGSKASTWFALMPWASASIIEGFVGECWDKCNL